MKNRPHILISGECTYHIQYRTYNRYLNETGKFCSYDSEHIRWRETSKEYFIDREMDTPLTIDRIEFRYR
jgi:hypothetical protein